jgi:hypothetical protein
MSKKYQIPKADWPVYTARVGQFGAIRAWKHSATNTYRFTFFNGVDYTPLVLSADAAFYLWLFIGVLHPDCDKDIKVDPRLTKKSAKKPTVKKKTKAK